MKNMGELKIQRHPTTGWSHEKNGKSSYETIKTTFFFCEGNP